MTRKAHFSYFTALAVALGTLALGEGEALGQSHPARNSTVSSDFPASDEIIVTARKRQESILNVPVVEQALSQATLQRLNVINMSDLPTLVPGLELEHTFLSIGTLVSIRGIGTTSEDPGVQQSVGLNIDGMSLSSGLAFNSGLFDLGQVEVLKGPQALFYGKSSPGGVISLRTADPTDKTEVIGTFAYEFESLQPRGELIVSGPVTDTLKLRLAGSYFAQQGYFHIVSNPLPETGAKNASGRGPDQQDGIVRLTALWNPANNFSARFKATYNHDLTEHPDTRECAGAPGGLAPLPGLPPELGGGATCQIGRTIYTVDFDPKAFPAAINGGVPFIRTDQAYSTLELDYHPDPQLTLSSNTSYYHLTESSEANAANSTYAGAFIGANNHFRDSNFSEEGRLNSDYAGPLNFTLGALYQTDDIKDRVTISGNTLFLLPPVLADALGTINSRTYSAFGQGRWKIVPKVELTAGVRYTDEKRSQAPFSYLTNSAVVPVVSAVRSRKPAPEFTLTYKPTADITLFGAYKIGYKSGGFSIATPVTAAVDNSFHDEQVKGFEGGIKARLFERQWLVNLAGYHYRYTGLQVGVVSPPSDGLPVIQTLNAATAKVYGVDFDTSFRPRAIAGLELNASVLWNHARFETFTNAPCWGGQTISEGCNQLFNPLKGSFTAQNLSGTPLADAPDWKVTAGLTYTMPLENGWKLTFTNSNTYSTDYVRALDINRPNNDNIQTAYAKVDVGVTLHGPRDSWEVSVLGKNVTDKIISSHCETGLIKGGAVVANSSGSATVGPLGIDQSNCFVDPGREVWLRLTLRPMN